MQNFVVAMTYSLKIDTKSLFLNGPNYTDDRIVINGGHNFNAQTPVRRNFDWIGNNL